MATTRKKLACCCFLIYILIILPVCGFCAIAFLENTKLTFEPPPSSPVEKTDTFLKNFKQLAPAPLFILITSSNGNVVQGQNLEIVARFTTSIQSLAYSDPHYRPHVHGFEAYTTVNPALQSNFVSTDGKITFISINYHSVTDEIGETYSLWLQSQMNNSPQYKLNSTSLSWEITGLGLLVNDITSGTGDDFIRIDMISLPCAIAVLAYCLQSLRVLFIPLVCLPLSVAISFTIMLPFTYAMNVSVFTPDMMGAMISALNIDYALFILSRFQEQINVYQVLDLNNDDVQWSIVKRTTKLAAHNILVSGITVAMANAGIAVFPMDMLRTIGIGCAFAVLSTIFVSMTVQPLMLYVFFHFFRVPTTIPKFIKRGASRLYQKLSGLDPVEEEERKPLSRSTLEDVRSQNLKVQNESPWFRVARIVEKYPIRILLIVVVVGIPFFVFVPQLKASFDLFVQIPRNAVHLPPFRSIMTGFGAGKTSPYYILIDSGKPNGITNEAFFTAVQNVVSNFSRVSGQPPAQFLSIAYIPQFGNIPWSVAQQQLATDVSYQSLWNQTVCCTNQSVLLNLFTTFPPIGTEAKPFLDLMVPFVRDYKDPAISFIGISGGGSDSWAVMQWVMEWFPYQIGITFAVIFVFIGIAFKSVAVPARMLFTVGYTVAFTYGLAVTVFEYTWLDGAWTALNGVDGIFWIIPIQSFTVICGLALDYDVFLLSRVIEYRRKGYEDSAALCKAVVKTGRIISFAGIIMAIAFSSLLGSQIMVMNQAGLLLSVAVLLDTFIIRTLFTPAFMSLFPKYAFWPAKLPNGYRGINDMAEDEDDEGSSTEPYKTGNEA